MFSPPGQELNVPDKNDVPKIAVVDVRRPQWHDQISKNIILKVRSDFWRKREHDLKAFSDFQRKENMKFLSSPKAEKRTVGLCEDGDDHVAGEHRHRCLLSGGDGDDYGEDDGYDDGDDHVGYEKRKIFPMRAGLYHHPSL